MKKCLYTLAVVVSVSCTSAAAHAQTDPAVLAVQNQQAIADAQLKIQQDAQAALTGMLPSSSATPNSGAYAVSGTAPFPSEKIAYEQLQKIAKTLTSEALTSPLPNGSPTGPIILFDSGELSNLLNYNALMATITLLNGQATDLRTAYNPLHTAVVAAGKPAQASVAQKDFAPMLVPGLVLGALKTTTDIIGMFRTNTNVAYNSYTPDDTALAAAVSHEILAAGKALYSPSQMPLSLNSSYAVASSTFMQALTTTQKKFFDLQTDISKDQANLQQLSDALAAYIAANQAGLANVDATVAETDKTKKLALQTKQKGLDRATEIARTYVLTLYGVADPNAIDPATANVNKAVIDQLLKRIAVVYTSVAAASTAFTAIQTALVSVSSNGTSSMTAILRAEALLDKVKGAGAVILSLKTSILGGAVVTRQNAFTGGHLNYTGGAIVTYVLFDANGNVLKSNVLVSEGDTKNVKY